MKEQMFLEVKGKHKEWIFMFEGDTEHLESWRADGLEVNVVHGSIPYWMAGTFLARPWVELQRAWRWFWRSV